jgi:DnaJ homolog subfamily A member 2
MDFDPFSFMGMGGGQGKKVKRKIKSKLIQINITLEEAYLGGKKNIEFERKRTCAKCKGTGSANPAANSKCSGCQGKGIKLVVQRMGNMILQQQTTCPDCNGEGNVIKDKCKTCKGERIASEKKKLEIEIDHRYTFQKEGDEIPEVEAGDIIVEIFLEKHKSFIRKGADLIYKTNITLLEALTGFSFVFKHLDGRSILIKNKEKEIIKPGKIYF